MHSTAALQLSSKEHDVSLPLLAVSLLRLMPLSQEQSGYATPLFTVRSAMAPVSTLCMGTATQLFARCTGHTSSSFLCFAASHVQCQCHRLAHSGLLIRHLNVPLTVF